jgi:hypothetical protein
MVHPLDLGEKKERKEDVHLQEAQDSQIRQAFGLGMGPQARGFFADVTAAVDG